MNTFLYKLKHLFSKKTDFRKVDDVRLEFAFEVGGVKYYEPNDLNLFPWQRMLSATSAYNKMSIGIREEDIRYASTLTNKVLSSGAILLPELMNLKRVNDILVARLDSQYRPEELMWNVAAVVFLDETESPYVYDPVYGAKKIAFWKKHKEVTGFFLQMSVKRLIPFLPATEEHSKLFTETIAELGKVEKDILEGKASVNLYQQQKMALDRQRSRSSSGKTSRN